MLPGTFTPVAKQSNVLMIEIQATGAQRAIVFHHQPTTSSVEKATTNQVRPTYHNTSNTHTSSAGTSTR